MDDENVHNEIDERVVAERKLTRRRLGVWLLAPLGVSFILLFIFMTEWKDSLTIRKYDVLGIRIVSKQEIAMIAQAVVSKDASMYGTDIGIIQEKIAAQPFIKSVTVTRQMPDVLRVQVTERDPIASLNIGHQMYYVDIDGVLLPYTQSSEKLDVPVISGINGIEHVRTGEVASNNDVYQAIDILKTSQAIDSSQYRFISEVNMNNGGDITIYSADVGVPIILGRGDVAKKLVTLQSFWNTIIKSQDPKKLRYVDLRFDEQVVVKWDQQTEHFPKKASL
ncbi:MAG: FtsQ-type POTRA domain-containing protein [Ignavibacteria bacterium]|nr:FtsQ-type POTRA domain-containing protein [Ignavibacteria bacterium]